MAFIAVNELRTTGSELFLDSESFINELSNLDDTVHGGGNDYSNSTNGVLDLAVKGFEFGVITYGIDAIGHLGNSYSDAGYY
ncbi:MAG TPA: hypothetical protein IGS40_23775 [Trichormus sp. M33_DOE_039]|nr:hypothetical protein [Trichormus sp. M33_DOE_039]